MGWFREHPWISWYLVASILWALWNIARASIRRRTFRLREGLILVLFAPILMPLSLLRSRHPAWMDLRWKCPNCAWAMFEETCEECGATGLPYDPVAHRVIDEDPEP